MYNVYKVLIARRQAIATQLEVVHTAPFLLNAQYQIYVMMEYAQIVLVLTTVHQVIA